MGVTLCVTLCVCVDEAKSMLHFKLRALDLIEIFVRKEPTNPLVLVRHMTCHVTQ